MTIFRIISVACIAILPTFPSRAEHDQHFIAHTIDDSIQIGYGLAIGDIDGDGDDDVLLADKRDFVWYENPTWEKHLFWTLETQETSSSMRDNVCIAAKDLDGDGKVEVAVGTNWNPGETASEEKSGGVWFVGSLGRIEPVKLPHDPTTHRMGWARGERNYALVVVPLHGRGNQGGTGKNGSRIFAYDTGKNPYRSDWKRRLVDDSLHKTHNFDIFETTSSRGQSLLLGGAEGFRIATSSGSGWNSAELPGMDRSPGELRVGKLHEDGSPAILAAIEPMHGNNVVYYEQQEAGIWERTVLDNRLHQGHAIAIADLLGTGSMQVVAGWRNRDSKGRVGIRLYTPTAEGRWEISAIDDDNMACEDIKLADLNADGRLDIIASGRSTKNVIIYWNHLVQPTD
ncbi:MAG: hypothetical protein CMI15_05335 [Opitutaceae bacterium]|nr:hypothetical protein [Opitutaceae bacterium]